MINDKIISRFLDGTANEKERKMVRNHLCQNPNDIEKVFFLMDKDTDIFIERSTVEHKSVSDASSVKGVTMKDIFVGNPKRIDSVDDFLDRLKNMYKNL